MSSAGGRGYKPTLSVTGLPFRTYCNADHSTQCYHEGSISRSSRRNRQVYWRAQYTSMARNGLRTRPPGGPKGGRRRRASDPFRIHTTSHAHTARSRVRSILVLVTAISRMRAGPMVARATLWSSKLSTPRSHRHWFCIVAILRSRSFTQAGPWIIATQPARNALPRRDLGF